MQVTRKYTDLFAEKLKATGYMQQAITKAVWIAYLDGIAESLSDEFKDEILRKLTVNLVSGDTFNLKIELGTSEIWTNFINSQVVVNPTFIGVDWDETRIDVIGANGNEGLHYVK